MALPQKKHFFIQNLSFDSNLRPAGFSAVQNIIFVHYPKIHVKVATAISRIGFTLTGKNLVDNLIHRTEITEISNRGNKSSITDENIIQWNADQINSGFNSDGNQYSPNWLILAHEMAHVRSTLNKIILPLGSWQRVGQEDQPISWDEINATHLENKLRAENGLPLRTHYATSTDPAKGREEPEASTSLLQFNSTKSKYITNDEIVKYRGLNKKDKAFDYSGFNPY